VLQFNPRRADRAGWRLVETVAEWRGVPLGKLLGRDRGEADFALARQIAMYVMHVCYQRHYAEVGRFFGRDRTTVSHACALVEEMREDPRFDAELDRIEASLLNDVPAVETRHAARG
jgi:chromosomal replication initiation ATPase DnaA